MSNHQDPTYHTQGKVLISLNCDQLENVIDGLYMQMFCDELANQLRALHVDEYGMDKWDAPNMPLTPEELAKEKASLEEILIDVLNHSSLSGSTQENDKAISISTAKQNPEDLAVQFREMVESNPKFDAAKLPPNWKELWASDFDDLLNMTGDPAVLQKVMAVSQSPKQAEYNIRPAALIKNLDILLKLVNTAGVTTKNEHYAKMQGGKYAKVPFKCLHCSKMFTESAIKAYAPNCKADSDELEFDIEADDDTF